MVWLNQRVPPRESPYPICMANKRRLLQPKWTIHSGPPPGTQIPLQTNNYDCGIFVCLYAAFIFIQHHSPSPNMIYRTYVHGWPTRWQQQLQQHPITHIHVHRTYAHAPTDTVARVRPARVKLARNGCLLPSAVRLSLSRYCTHQPHPCTVLTTTHPHRITRVVITGFFSLFLLRNTS